MGKITFFEEKKFQGRCYNCSSDRADLHTHFSHCSSIWVESGIWVIYARPSYKGFRCILTPGEYADNQQWVAFSDPLPSHKERSTPPPVYGSSWKLRLYEKPDFGGQMFECFDDCPSMNEMHSCVVANGTWVLYELPNYMGHQYVVERGDYRQHGDWGVSSPGIGSFRRITEF
uniref:Gamma-crystallin M2-like n=1 Tax=Nothobranchius furzeri TaxID=105023 RepID=A0A8C6Q052_NOTFU